MMGDQVDEWIAKVEVYINRYPHLVKTGEKVIETKMQLEKQSFKCIEMVSSVKRHLIQVHEAMGESSIETAMAYIEKLIIALQYRYKAFQDEKYHLFCSWFHLEFKKRLHEQIQHFKKAKAKYEKSKAKCLQGRKVNLEKGLRLDQLYKLEVEHLVLHDQLAAECATLHHDLQIGVSHFHASLQRFMAHFQRKNMETCFDKLSTLSGDHVDLKEAMVAALDDMETTHREKVVEARAIQVQEAQIMKEWFETHLVEVIQHPAVQTTLQKYRIESIGDRMEITALFLEALRTDYESICIDLLAMQERQTCIEFINALAFFDPTIHAS